MRVGVSETGVSLFRRAMGWLFGCFKSTKPQEEKPHNGQKHSQVFPGARRALRKVTTRRDKAQVLPDSPGYYKNGAEDNKKQEQKVRDKAPEEDNLHYCVEGDGACNKKGHLCASYKDSSLAIDNARSSSKEESNTEGYLNIEAVFPASLFSAGDKENLAVDDLLNHQDEFFVSKEKNNQSRGSIFAPVENLPTWDDCETSVSFSSGSKSQSRLSFDEKPIMGLVAAELIEADSEVKSYKPWDGKGIPNSTTKYKEDQKVNFQTTSFEARLERALASQSAS